MKYVRYKIPENFRTISNRFREIARRKFSKNEKLPFFEPGAMFRHPESYKEGSGKDHLCFSVEFSKYIFERSHFTILKVMSFFENDHQIHQMFCKLVNI